LENALEQCLFILIFSQYVVGLWFLILCITSDDEKIQLHYMQLELNSNSIKDNEMQINAKGILKKFL
jgi:hypothetical protein